MTTLPQRELRDPKALRAFAHPVRLQLIEELVVHGPATATELAERVGESSANCSWHLRQLARYGFVEEAGGGTGRQRPWRAVVQANSWGRGEQSPELFRAGMAASDVLLTREYEAMREWFATRRDEPSQWRDAGFVDQSLGWLTAAELAEVDEQIQAILMRYLDRVTDPERRPADSRFVRFVAWGVPGRPHTEEA